MSVILAWISWNVPIGSPNCAAFVHVGQGDVERGGHQAQRAAGQHYAFGEVEPGHQHAHAATDFAQHVLDRDFAVGEYQFAGVGAAHAELEPASAQC